MPYPIPLMCNPYVSVLLFFSKYLINRFRKTKRNFCIVFFLFRPNSESQLKGSSTLDDGNGSQFDALLADASRMAGVYYVRDILIRFGCLFHDQFGWCDADGNAECLHIVQHVGVLEVTAGFRTRKGSTLVMWNDEGVFRNKMNGPENRIHDTLWFEWNKYSFYGFLS